MPLWAEQLYVSRTDHVVIGGTFELGVDDETPDKAVCQSLVDHIKSLFGLAPVLPLPEIHIHHPDHAPIVNPAMQIFPANGMPASSGMETWPSPLPITF
jgi:hypothetical protein